jgi:2'-hydroxyisoflavone reductase
MRILVLGGTRFLGRAIVDAARARGHALTLFNRGREDPAAYPEVEQVRGDRTRGAAPGGLAALAGRAFDAVVDTACYLPRDATAAATFFAGAAPRYVLVSSISALAAHDSPGYDETAPVARLTAEQEKEVAALSAEGPIPAARLGPFYGPLKALCEEAVEAAMPGRALVVRPGLIVGPHDNTDRFTYWPARFLRGGTVLAPGRPQRSVQFIDVRDLGEWMVRALEAGTTGTFHAVGPATPLPFGTLLEACARVAAARGAPPSTVTWIDEATLLAAQVAPWTELPLWIPEDAEGMRGMMKADVTKAVAAGLTFRPLDETIAATLDWDATRPADAPRVAGLAAAREAEVLARAPAPS